jgi:hypothetical protein
MFCLYSLLSFEGCERLLPANPATQQLFVAEYSVEDLPFYSTATAAKLNNRAVQPTPEAYTQRKREIAAKRLISSLKQTLLDDNLFLTAEPITTQKVNCFAYDKPNIIYANNDYNGFEITDSCSLNRCRMSSLVLDSVEILLYNTVSGATLLLTDGIITQSVTFDAQYGVPQTVYLNFKSSTNKIGAYILDGSGTPAQVFQYASTRPNHSGCTGCGTAQERRIKIVSKTLNSIVSGVTPVPAMLPNVRIVCDFDKFLCINRNSLGLAMLYQFAVCVLEDAVNHSRPAIFSSEDPKQMLSYYQLLLEKEVLQVYKSLSVSLKNYDCGECVRCLSGKIVETIY